MTSSKINKINKDLIEYETLVKNDILNIKNNFTTINNFKRRFYFENEEEFLKLNKNIVYHKSMRKEIYAKSKEDGQKIKAKYDKKIKELKDNYGYDLYELKESRKLKEEKIKSGKKNYVIETKNKISNLKLNLKMIQTNKNPFVLKEIHEKENQIDRLKLSIESIKKQFKYNKMKENALLANDGVKFFERKKKLKPIVSNLKDDTEKKIETAKNDISSLELEINNLKSISVDDKNNKQYEIENEIVKIEKELNTFDTEFIKYYNDNVNKFENEYLKTKQEVEEKYELDLKNIMTEKELVYNEYLEKNSKENLNELKKFHTNKLSKNKLALKELKKKIRNLNVENKEETRKFIKQQKNIKNDSLTNIKIVINELKEEKNKIDENNQEIYDNVLRMYNELSDEFKSVKKIVREQKFNYSLRNINTAYFFIAPAVFGAVVFTILPLIFMLVAAFFKVDIVNLGKSQFVGFSNFYNIFKYDVQFRQSLVNTLIYALITIGLLSVVTLGMAAWLSKNTKIHNAVTTMVFTPHIASLVAISILWIALLSPSGVINQILGIFGIEGPRWLLQENTSLLSVSMVTVWKDIGYYVLLIIAGLQAIPSYVYEAAKLDKSSKWNTFFRITVPLLAPTLSFVFVNKFINSFKVFAPIEIMTNGGPMGSSTVLSYWIYKVGRLGFNYGQAMAGAIVLTLIITFFTIINHKFFNRKIEY